MRTVDTDEVVLAVASFSTGAPDETWFACGVGSNIRYLAFHEMVDTINPTKCLILPVLHAFTGYDSVSSFAGRGNNVAWETWKCFPEVNCAFKETRCMPSEICDADVRSNELGHRSERCQTLDNIRPTQAVLKQHIKRSRFQANCCNHALV